MCASSEEQRISLFLQKERQPVVTFCIALKKTFLDYLQQGGGALQLTVSSLGSSVFTLLWRVSSLLTDIGSFQDIITLKAFFSVGYYFQKVLQQGLGKSINSNRDLLRLLKFINFKTENCLITSKYCLFLDDLFNIQ